MSELQKVDQTELALNQSVDLGFNTGIEDIKAPIGYIKLVQPTTTNPGNGRVGDWIDSQGEVVNDHQFVLIKTTPKRVYYPKGGENSGPPLCKSDDGVKPSPYVETPQAANCKDCHFSKWSKDGGVSVPPPCSDAIQFDCLDLTTGLPVRISFKGTGLDPAKTFMTTLKARVLSLSANIAKGQAENPLPGFKTDFYSFRFNLGCIAHPKRPVRIPVLKVVGTVDEQNKDLVSAFLVQVAEQAKQQQFNILNNNKVEEVIEHEFEEA